MPSQPSAGSKVPDARNRKEGYATYKVGNVYFNPDEIFSYGKMKKSSLVTNSL